MEVSLLQSLMAGKLKDLEKQARKLRRTEIPENYEKCVSTALNFLIHDGDALQYPGNGGGLGHQSKSNTESMLLREEGNEFFRSNSDILSMEKALECYTKSIAHAEADSEEIALGYANRAAVLLKLNRPKECLEDIERVLHNNNYPEKSKPKLYMRQGDTYLKLVEHSYIAAKYWLEKVPKGDVGRSEQEEILKDYLYSESIYKEISNEQPEVPLIKSPSSQIPYMSDAVEVVYSGPFEQKLVATRDIDIGETLAVEDKPYSQFLLDKYSFVYCSHCMCSLWNSIPCDNCANVVYCSEKCKTLAWENYHQTECPMLDAMIQSYDGIIHERARSARLLLQIYHDCGDLERMRERVKNLFNDCSKYGKELKDKWFKERSLESVLLLNTRIEILKSGNIINAVANALGVLFHLATATDIFGQTYEQEYMDNRDILLSMSKNPDVIFVGGLITKLCLLSQVHHEMRADYNFENGEINYGSQLVPLSGTMKCACHANTVARFLRNSHVIVNVDLVKKGEELLKFHALSWVNYNKSERLKKMPTKCDCEACKNDWPLLEGVKSYEKQAKSFNLVGKMKKALRPLPQIKSMISSKEIRDMDQVFNDLRRMMNVIDSGANRPCREYVQMIQLLLRYFKMTSNPSKLKKLHMQ